MASTPIPRYLPAKDTRFSTYRPGSTKPGATAANTIHLKPGEKLAYQQGRGYYAKTGVAPAPAPARTPPTAPGRTAAHAPTPTPTDPYGALSQSELDLRASTLARSSLTVQQEEIRRQQAHAEAVAKNDYSALGGFAQAGAALEGGYAGDLAKAYSQATQDQGQLGTGIAGAVGQDLRTAQGNQDAFAQQIGQAGAAHGFDPQNVQNTLGMLQSKLPGDLLSTQGMANVSEAYRAPTISLAAGREEIQARMAQAHNDGDDYAQKLLSLAATYPDLKAKTLEQLNQYELDKANYRQKVMTDAQDNARANRALHDNEVLAGIKGKGAQTKLAAAQSKVNREFAYKYATLKFKTQQEANKVAAAAKAGKAINVQVSKLLGHVVYKDNTQDPSIKVAQSTAAGTAAGKKATATYKARSSITDSAISLRGSPIDAPAADLSAPVGQGHGKFLADRRFPRGTQNEAGKFTSNGRFQVFPDGTTNRPERAAFDQGGHTYAQAQALILGQVGPVLIDQYHLNPAQVNQWIASALNAAGWKR